MYSPLYYPGLNFSNPRLLFKQVGRFHRGFVDKRSEVWSYWDTRWNLSLVFFYKL